MSARTSAREVVPFGVLTIVVCSHSGARLGDALLEERAALGAVREPLHQGRPPARGAQQRLGDGEVVPHQVELRLAPLREEDLVRARDRDLAPRDVEHALLRHAANSIRS